MGCSVAAATPGHGTGGRTPPVPRKTARRLTSGACVLVLRAAPPTAPLSLVAKQPRPAPPGLRMERKFLSRVCLYWLLVCGSRKEAPRYAVGDYVVCRSLGGDVSVCQIAGLRQDSTGERYILCKWFYRPEETPGGRLPSHGCCELFSSDDHSVDIAPADTILCKCRVLSGEAYTAELSAAVQRAICAASTSACTPERLASPAGSIPVSLLEADASWVGSPHETTSAAGREQKIEARLKCVQQEIKLCLEHLLGRVTHEVELSAKLGTSYSTAYSVQTARTANLARPQVSGETSVDHAARQAQASMRNVYYTRMVYSAATTKVYASSPGETSPRGLTPRTAGELSTSPPCLHTPLLTSYSPRAQTF